MAGERAVTGRGWRGLRRVVITSRLRRSNNAPIAERPRRETGILVRTVGMITTAKQAVAVVTVMSVRSRRSTEAFKRGIRNDRRQRNALPDRDPPDVTPIKAAAAKRVQAHRARARVGLRCLTVRVSDRQVRHLISNGYLSLESSEAAAAVAIALEAWVADDLT